MGLGFEYFTSDLEINTLVVHFYALNGLKAKSSSFSILMRVIYDGGKHQQQIFLKSASSTITSYLSWGWFSMSPLPRLHHHDIIAIVDLFDYCGVITPCHNKVLLSHFNT